MLIATSWNKTSLFTRAGDFFATLQDISHTSGCHHCQTSAVKTNTSKKDVGIMNAFLVQPPGNGHEGLYSFGLVLRAGHESKISLKYRDIFMTSLAAATACGIRITAFKSFRSPLARFYEMPV